MCKNRKKTIQVLNQLKKMGVQLAIDDFDTGYSSLSYLKQFPVDSVKTDQSFVRELFFDSEDGIIISAVVMMAHSLNLQVIAEGVENREHLDFLTKEGCDLIQGYFFVTPYLQRQFNIYLDTQSTTIAGM